MNQLKMVRQVVKTKKAPMTMHQKKILKLMKWLQRMTRMKMYQKRIPNPKNKQRLRNRRKVMRSEERRVGKECRSRWWRYNEKKKKKRVRGGAIWTRDDRNNKSKDGRENA